MGPKNTTDILELDCRSAGPKYTVVSFLFGPWGGHLKSTIAWMRTLNVQLDLVHCNIGASHCSEARYTVIYIQSREILTIKIHITHRGRKTLCMSTVEMPLHVFKF